MHNHNRTVALTDNLIWHFIADNTSAQCENKPEKEVTKGRDHLESEGAGPSVKF